MEDGKVIHLCSESCIAENDALWSNVMVSVVLTRVSSFETHVVRNIGVMLPHLRSSIFFDLS